MKITHYVIFKKVIFRIKPINYEKDCPQPQVDVALGFETLKPAPCKAST